MITIKCPTCETNWKKSNLPFPENPFLLECNDCTQKIKVVEVVSPEKIRQILRQNYPLILV